jgi:hypothetical protein
VLQIRVAPVPFLAMRNHVTLGVATMLAIVGTACMHEGALPTASAASATATESTSAETAAIEQREICVGSSVASAGVLADTLYYRAAMLPDGKLAVGYFAFFSEERPWGNNWLTWTVLPAIALDLVYTRSMMVGPGLQRAMYGKGDVEGFRIIYDVRPDGSLEVERAFADDGSHDPVQLERADVMGLDAKRPTVYSDTWSHQLGGRGLRDKAALSYVRCFGAGHVRPLTDALSDDFALAGRAPPAHVEALGGRVLGAPLPVTAQASVPARPRPPM